MTTNINYEVPTWSQIYEMLLSQAQKIKSQNFTPDIIVGITRGGLVPARILTDLLETEQITTIQIKFYLDLNQTKTEPTIKQTLNMPLEGKKTLLVDDIADSGKSLQVALNHIKRLNPNEIKTATLYCKSLSAMKPDFWEKGTNLWVVFPWECKETLRKIFLRSEGKQEIHKEVTKLVKAGFPKQLANKLLLEM